MTIELFTTYNVQQGGDSDLSVVDEGGVWTLTGSTTGFPVVIGGESYSLNDTIDAGSSNPSLDFTGTTAGFYEFTYTVSSAGNCTASAGFVIEVQDKPAKPIALNKSICFESGFHNFSTSLFSGPTDGTFRLIQAPSGSTAPSDFQLPRAYSWTGQATGFYTYLYTVTNANGCQEVDTFTIENIGEVLANASIDVCNTDGIINLLDQLPDSYTEPIHGVNEQQESGSWSVSPATGAFAANTGGNTSTFNTALAANGTYTLTYTYDVLGRYTIPCQRTATLTINVVNTATAYPNQPGTVCVD